MAVLLLLGVLVTCVSYYGTSANTGLIISKGGLENFYQSSKDPLQTGLEDYLKGLPPSTVPAHFLEVTVAALVVTKVEPTLVPAFGLNVSICSSIHLRCVTPVSAIVTLIVDECTTIRLRGSSQELIIDDCSTVFGDIRLDVLSISVQVPRVALINVLDGLICQAHIVVCMRLNFPLRVDLASIPLPAGCRYDPLAPKITDLLLELPFVAVCEGVTKPQRPVDNCGLSYPGVLDNNFVYYTSTYVLNCLLTALLSAGAFNKEITLEAVTTTTILENFPQVSCPRDLSVVVRIVCTSINAEIGASGVYLGFNIQATIGYVSSGENMLPFCILFCEFSVVGSCKTRPCVLDNAVAERVFQLRKWCTDILSVSLKERLYLILPINFSCGTCSTGDHRQGCAYISCSPAFVW